jgi:hypothetical protein
MLRHNEPYQQPSYQLEEVMIHDGQRRNHLLFWHRTYASHGRGDLLWGLLPR